VLAVGVGLVLWKNKVGGHTEGSFNSISREEVELLLANVAKTNPLVLKRFSDDPSMKKQQLDNLKQLLAFASEAQAEGLASESPNKEELRNIRSEVIAVNYDREINKDKGPMPAFGFISEDQVKEFWGEGENAPTGTWASLKDKLGYGPSARQREFEKFLETKLAVLKEKNPQMQDREITDDERTQAKDFYAKIKIYENEFDEKAGSMPKEFRDMVALQVKLQQATYLAGLFSEKLAEKVKVTDEDVQNYIAQHPELDPAAKRQQAQEILNRAKAGEDFAALANQYSQDPGNKDPKTGEGKGGLYPNTPKGMMVPAFEQAALALEPGQIAPELVETDYGYHIIKLEKKGEGKDAQGNPTETYDARHILISTGYKDPDMPGAREVPVKTYVRRKLEEEKEKQLIDDIVARNHVSVPDDFSVPPVSDEQIKDMMQKQQQQQQMQMQGMGDEEGEEGERGPKPAPSPAKKPEAKKK
jgi:parvulin-like peptidyl-prolyl isomerase